MKLNVTITAQEIMDRGAWDKFCELREINQRCVSEGFMDSDEQFTLSLREIVTIGVDWTEIAAPL